MKWFFMVVSLIGLNVVSGDGWQSLNGPEAGRVNCFAFRYYATKTIYAGTNEGGLFKSTDNGETWVFNGLKGKPVLDLALHPTDDKTMFAAAYSALMRTTDGGTSWQDMGLTGAFTPSFITSIALNKDIPNTFFVGGSYSGVPAVFKTTNGGNSWSKAELGSKEGKVTTVRMNPGNPLAILAGGFRTANNQGFIYRTDNGGGLWGITLLLGKNNRLSSLAFTPGNPDIVYAGTDNGVYYSGDGGISWWARDTVTVKGVTNIVVDPKNPSTVYAATTNGIYRSINAGTIWNKVDTGLTTKFVNALTIDTTAPKTLYAGTEGDGIFKTTNGGGDWSRANSGLSAGWLNAVISDPLQSDIIYAGGYGGIFRYSSGNWAEYATGIGPYRLVTSLASDSSKPYAIINNDVYCGNDFGQVWTSLNLGEKFPGLDLRVVNANPENPGTIFAAGQYNNLPAVFKTQDGGVNWTKKELATSEGVIYAFACDPQNLQTVFAAGYYKPADNPLGVIFKSTDGGLTWNVLKEFTTELGSTIYALAIDPVNPQVLFIGREDDIYKSLDGGVNWTRLSANIIARTIRIDPGNTNIVYAGGNGFMRSLDGGATWTDISQGLPPVEVGSFILNGSTIYAATTGGGVYKLTVTALAEKTENPTRAPIYLYPNPGSKVITIKYQITGEPKLVSLKVYDSHGRLVRTLLNKIEPVGTHTVQWDGRIDSGEPVSPGVYFPRLETKGYQATMKLVRLR